MSYLETVSRSGVPVSAVVLLSMVFILGLFVVGYDQGHTAELLQGIYAFEGTLIHEFAHDARHAAGFACH